MSGSKWLDSEQTMQVESGISAKVEARESMISAICKPQPQLMIYEEAFYGMAIEIKAADILQASVVRRLPNIVIIRSSSERVAGWVSGLSAKKRRTTSYLQDVSQCTLV